MSHQVGLVWQGGNGWDDLVREQVRMPSAKDIWDLSHYLLSDYEQVEESTVRQRLGGRRDSAAQISGATPPSTSPPPGKVSTTQFPTHNS